MSLYLDSSALLKRYVDEPGSDLVIALMAADHLWLTAHHTVLEVRRNLARLLGGSDLVSARQQFLDDCRAIDLVAIDATTIEIACTIAETTLSRSLDALHLAAATRLGGAGLTFVTFDRRQAEAARQLGFVVNGG